LARCTSIAGGNGLDSVDPFLCVVSGDAEGDADGSEKVVVGDSRLGVRFQPKKEPSFLLGDLCFGTWVAKDGGPSSSTGVTKSSWRRPTWKVRDSTDVMVVER